MIALFQATDFYAGALYNGYDNITHFYTEMSSILPYRDGCSDVSTTRSSSRSNKTSTKRRRIPIPHLVLHAMDDPLSTWRTNTANDPKSALYPANLISAQGNLVLLLTSTGGHVGWPMGLWPNSWAFMNDYVAARFVTAYDEHHHNDSEDFRQSGNNFAVNHSGTLKMEAVHARPLVEGITSTSYR